MNHSLRRRLLLCTAVPVLFAAPAGAQTAPAGSGTPAPAAQPAGPVKPLGTVTPRWGDIRTFWGDIRTFSGESMALWGDIRTFQGDVSPYWGDIRTFWGDIHTFNDGTTHNNAAPLWGDIRTFSGDLGAQWGDIRTFWGDIRTFQDAPQDYRTLATKISGMINQSQAFWGKAVQQQSGKDFMSGFAQPLLNKYGIDINNASTLAKLDVNAREHFFIDWYDGLMNYSGADHVDHWMNEVHWTPALTQQVGMSGTNSTVGLLDFSITGDAAQSVVKYSGISTIANGHGTAVASLIVGAHDGKGVMGIAPKASVISYNPFDATQTAGWADIKTGVLTLAKSGASIINMSLGVPGWTFNPEWNAVFSDKAVFDATRTNKVFVLAAGNDGITQTQNVVWKKDNANFIIVGSVDPSGTISTFSNRPGSVCLLDVTTCRGDYLRNHFIVAPGELILVDDGMGGVTRYSGTSFAAPLVSGTIALLHDRWPWLVNFPDDTANIILKSARDVGAPGVDDVYGVGMLDVERALSVLDWNSMKFKMVQNGKITDMSAPQLRATTAAQRATWEANSVYFSTFQDTGDSSRDFQIPLSSKLANQTVSVNGSAEQFMGYLTSRFSTWLGAPTRLVGGSYTPAQFSSTRGNTTRLYGFGDGVATLTMAPKFTRIGFRGSEVPFQSALRIASPDRGFALELGNGESAPAVGGQRGFTMASDYDVTSGGANPFVGLAAGGAYAKTEVALARGLTLSSSVTQRSLRANLDGQSLTNRQALGAYDPYRASAGNMTLSYDVGGALTTSLGYTMLHENTALLGMQSVDRADLAEGSTTDATTFGMDLGVARGLTLSGSATVGRTRAGDLARSNIVVGRGGMISTAFQVAAAKEHVLDSHDRLRLTMAQPMHVERGSIDLQMVRVIDRQTGEIGVVTESASLTAPDRRYVGELIYGRSLMDGVAELSLFGRANLSTIQTAELPRLTVGGSFRLGF